MANDKKSMDYRSASIARRKSLIDLIGEKKFEQGRGVTSSIGGAISEKLKASTKGIKEKLDPLNMIRGMTTITAKPTSLADKALFGVGNLLGRSAVTLAGRVTGRSSKDIKYFGGFGGFGGNSGKAKKDPNYSTIGSSNRQNLSRGDTIANILGKIYNFMQKTRRDDKVKNELDVAFRKEQLEEDERRHKKMVDAVLETQKIPQAEGAPASEDKKEKSGSLAGKIMKGVGRGMGKIISGIYALIKGILSIVTSIVKTLGKLVFSIGKFILSMATKIIKGILKTVGGYVLEAIGAATLFIMKKAKSLIQDLGKKLLELIVRGKLSGGVGGGKMGALGWTLLGLTAAQVMATGIQEKNEYSDFKFGEKFVPDERSKISLEGEKSKYEAAERDASNLTGKVGEAKRKEIKGKKDIVEKKLDDAKKLQIENVQEYHRSVLIPKMEEAGFDFSGYESDNLTPIFTNKDTGEVANQWDLLAVMHKISPILNPTAFAKQVQSQVGSKVGDLAEQGNALIKELGSELEVFTKSVYDDISGLGNRVKKLEDSIETSRANAEASLNYDDANASNKTESEVLKDREDTLLKGEIERQPIPDQASVDALHANSTSNPTYLNNVSNITNSTSSSVSNGMLPDVRDSELNKYCLRISAAI